MDGPKNEGDKGGLKDKGEGGDKERGREITIYYKGEKGRDGRRVNHGAGG